MLAPLAFIAANEIIYWTSWTTVYKLMLAVVAGYLLFGIAYALGDANQRPPVDPRSLIWFGPWLAGLTVISYLGIWRIPAHPGRIDLAVVAAFSLVICYLAVQLSLSPERIRAAIASDELEAATQPELKTAAP